LKVGVPGAVGLMMKSQLGLGVLSIPAAFDVLGLIPGIICLCMVSMMTTWAGWVIGDFKLRHVHVYSIDDAGALMFGRFGREFFGAALCIRKCPMA
jgi:amino acid permease